MSIARCLRFFICLFIILENAFKPPSVILSQLFFFSLFPFIFPKNYLLKSMVKLRTFSIIFFKFFITSFIPSSVKFWLLYKFSIITLLLFRFIPSKTDIKSFKVLHLSSYSLCHHFRPFIRNLLTTKNF